MSEQVSLFDSYDDFVEKFKPKKTTDDCYTPENVYEAVAAWVEKEYGVDRGRFVRPFWPGGDFEREAYPEGCIVVDNPPFSIMRKICDFYLAHGVDFFLFCPALTPPKCDEAALVAVGSSIRYDNGAEVGTSFVTTLEDCIVRSAPDLYDALEVCNDYNRSKGKASLPKYEYPDAVVTPSKVQWFSAHHTPYRLPRGQGVRIAALDHQRAMGKSIFGHGWLLTERAAAERAAALRWQLSPREIELQKWLSERGTQP